MKTDKEKRQRVTPYNDKPTEKDELFHGRHGTGPVFPYLGRAVVGPAFQGPFSLSIMGAMGTHHPYFNESKIGKDKEEPRN